MMRILRRCSVLLALPLAAACDGGGGTLPAGSDPIAGEWVTPTDPPLANAAVDRSELRLTYGEDGSYATEVLWMDDDAADPVVYRLETAGRYRVEAGAVSVSVRTVRHWNAARGAWQEEFVARPDEFGGPVPYSVERDRLTLYYSASSDGHGLSIPPREVVLTRR